MGPAQLKKDQDTLKKEFEILESKWPTHAEGEVQSLQKLKELLAKLQGPVQQEFLLAFKPVRDEVTERLNHFASELFKSITKATSLHLSTLLRKVEDSAEVRKKAYKLCGDTKLKADFLLAVATVVRCLQGEYSRFKSLSASEPKLSGMSQRLATQLFEIEGLGNTMKEWHDGRLSCYNNTWWRAAKAAVETLKADLQNQLVQAFQSKVGKAKNKELKLEEWPMASCPLAAAFTTFVQEHASDFGDLGSPPLAECPPHSLKPSTLRLLLCHLEPFEVQDPEAQEDSGSACIRLREEFLQPAANIVAAKAAAETPRAPKTAAPSVTASSPPASQEPVVIVDVDDGAEEEAPSDEEAEEEDEEEAPPAAEAQEKAPSPVKAPVAASDKEAKAAGALKAAEPKLKAAELETAAEAIATEPKACAVAKAAEPKAKAPGESKAALEVKAAQHPVESKTAAKPKEPEVDAKETKKGQERSKAADRKDKGAPKRDRSRSGSSGSESSSSRQKRRKKERKEKDRDRDRDRDRERDRDRDRERDRHRGSSAPLGYGAYYQGHHSQAIMNQTLMTMAMMSSPMAMMGMQAMPSHMGHVSARLQERPKERERDRDREPPRAAARQPEKQRKDVPEPAKRPAPAPTAASPGQRRPKKDSIDRNDL